MNWSPQQEQARRAVSRWIRDPSAPQVFYLAGYAGSGKTTLAEDLVSDSSRRWLFGAFTGKAAYVLQQKGCTGARTLHSLIYKPSGDENAAEIEKLETEIGKPETPPSRRTALAKQVIELRKQSSPRFTLWTTGPLSDRDTAGIVVDEVSMVDARLGRDLESFGKKILVIGDPAQLPPVKGGGYFTAREPDVMLTEVHRQAKESAVLRLATHIREGGSLSGFDPAPGVEIDPAERPTSALAADQVLVGLNKTRHDSNRRMRDLKNRATQLPSDGDRLVCLRNERERGLFNGSQWVVVDASPSGDKTMELTVRSEDDNRVVVTEAWLHYFDGRREEIENAGDKRRRHSEFDWGYALTVHKAQGSQYRRVLVVDESRRIPGIEPRRWMYTAITRSKEHVTILT